MKKFYATALVLLFGLLSPQWGGGGLKANPSQQTSQQTPQRRHVTGTVVGTAGPITGASVMIEGTQTGTSTDAQGRFAIDMLQGQALTVSFMGYDQQRIVPGVRTQLNIRLQTSTIELDRAVVTALGIRRDNRALGYATSTVTGEEMTKAGTTINPLTAIYGKAAGVGIQSAVSGPTGGVNIRIRGAAGLESSSSTRPLFVVDGVPIYDQDTGMNSRGSDPLNSFDYGTGINDVNPEDIESMEILKGAKASVLYGSRGANGVVLITTKRGANTRGLGVTLSWQHAWEMPHSYIDWQNEYGEGESTDWPTLAPDATFRPISKNRYSFGPKFDGTTLLRNWDGTDVLYQAYPDNFDDLFQQGSTDTFSASISGGNDRGNMRLSYTNMKYNGMLDNFWQKRNTVSFNGQMKVSDFARFEVTSNLYNTDTHNRPGNIHRIVEWGIHRGYDYNSLRDQYLTEDGYMNPAIWDDPSWNTQDSSTYMMQWWWNQYRNSNLDSNFHNISSARVTLNFTPWLYLVGSAGIDYTGIERTNKAPIERAYADGTYSGGKYGYQRQNSFMQNYSAMLTFDKSFMDDRLSILSFVGYEFRSAKDSYVSASTMGGLKYPDWYSLNNSKTTTGLLDNARSHSRASDVNYGLYGTVTVGWKGTYYLEVQARNDWTSTLPTANNSYFYPGVSFTYNFSDDFTIPGLTYGKLFTSFADVGRGAPRYFALRNYNIGKVETQPDVTTVSGPTDLFAGDLKPERKREFEIGLSTRWLNNRLEGNFSFYTNNTYDQIMAVPLSSVTGASRIRINAGNVAAWGYELFLKGTPLQTNNWRLDLALTLAKQNSKVKKLYPGITSKPLGGQGYSVVANVGERMGEIMMYDYVRDDQGNRIVGDGGSYLQNATVSNIGKNVNPDAFGGLTGDLFYKSLFLHFGIDYKIGGSIFSYSNYYLTALGLTTNTLAYRDEAHGGLAYYVKDGKTVAAKHTDATGPNGERIYHNGMILPGVKSDGGEGYVPNDIIRSSTSYYQSFLNDMSTSFQPDALYRNDYVKLREVSIGYTLPQKWSNKLKLQKVTVQFNARNLFYFYKTLPNVDAESTLGTSGTNSFFEQSFYPTMRSYGFGVNISF